MRTGASYPGLVELVGAFYEAVAARGPSPIAPSHLLQVTKVFQQLVARIDAAADRASRTPLPARTRRSPRRTVVTGARGFLGAEIARALSDVRGIGREGWPDSPQVQEFVVADLSMGLSAEAVAGADVVVHAAAETSGGYEAHQRNTIDATRHLLRAMHAAGVKRLVLVSSLSVLRPPRTPWERQDEHTPRPGDPRRLGPYTWGKCVQEELVEREAAELGITTRIVRPGALIDWDDPALPGLMGRRLFGRWHLGLGRPQLPIAVCDVKWCAEAIAWCVDALRASTPGGPRDRPCARDAPRVAGAPPKSRLERTDGLGADQPDGDRREHRPPARLARARTPSREARGLVDSPAAALRHASFAGAARGCRPDDARR